MHEDDIIKIPMDGGTVDLERFSEPRFWDKIREYLLQGGATSLYATKSSEPELPEEK